MGDDLAHLRLERPRRPRDPKRRRHQTLDLVGVCAAAPGERALERPIRCRVALSSLRNIDPHFENGILELP
jgi:hypothetical protein